MRRTVVRRLVILGHRWLGVALCLLVLVWFLSGIGMMYWTYPSVTDADRLDRAPALDPARIALSPMEAADRIRAVAIPGEMRLNTFDGRPVYRFADGAGWSRIVFADTGEGQRQPTAEQLDRIAGAWAGQPASNARVEAVEGTDQWTLATAVRNLRPLYRYVWPNGEQLYLAGETGEVMQYTTSGTRLAAWVSAIPHWLYFTPLRVRQSLWLNVIIWTALFTTVSAVLGLVIGAWLYSPEKRYRASGRSSRIPFRGQKRWHTVLGLGFGVGAVTWGFSGMMSVEPFPSVLERLRPTYSEAPPDRAALDQALRGRVTMGDFQGADLVAVLQRNPELGVRQLELTSFDGEPMLAANLGHDGMRMLRLDGTPVSHLDTFQIAAVARKMANDPRLVEIRLLDRYDLYYRDRKSALPLPVLLVEMNDQAGARFYIDPATARVVGAYDGRGWIERWLYHGLHSLDFPWLYNHRPLWDIIVITLMLGGAALSMTGVVLAYRRVTHWTVRALTGASRKSTPAVASSSNRAPPRPPVSVDR